MGFAERRGSTVAYGGAGNCGIYRLFGYTAVHFHPLCTCVVRLPRRFTTTSGMNSVAADCEARQVSAQVSATRVTPRDSSYSQP